MRRVRALAEHREHDVNADRQIRRDESRVHDFDGLVSGEVPVGKRGELVERVSFLDGVGEIGVRDGTEA